MDRFDRIFEVHKVLSNSRYPVARKIIQEKLECSRATFARIIGDMRDFLGAPIEYDRTLNGYYYSNTGERPYQLPGLWFNASEIYALLACQELLSNVQPGLLDSHIAPLKDRISKILESEHLAKGDVGKRIRILKMAFRKVPQKIFQIIANSALQKKRLNIAYHGRELDSLTNREVSPQRLAYYRDNWYLDAYCHLRSALRSFAVDRIQKAGVLKKRAKNIPEERLDKYFSESYGIFAGKPKNTAVLRFRKIISRWIANEEWHPKQKGRFVDGEYELEIPYSDPRELILDILRYGPDIQVLAPESLQKAVIARLERAVRQYGAK